MARIDRTGARLTRGIAHIERRIGADISLADVAAEAALSEFHFHRLFRARFGARVMDYVRRRRLTEAARALLHSPTPILRIALEAGFQSQAAFTRAFRKVFHTTPALYRARGREVPWLSSAPISAEALAMFPGLGQDRPRLERIDGFGVAGLAATLDGAGRSAIPQLWRSLAEAVGPDRFAAADRIGISENDDAVLGGVLGYMAALRTGPGQPIAPDLTRRAVPGGDYLVFALEGPAPTIADAYDFIFGIWMPGSRHVLRCSPSFTRLFPPNGDGRAGAIEIWIPVEGS